MTKVRWVIVVVVLILAALATSGVFLYSDGVPHQETTRQATVARQTPVPSSEESVWYRYEVPTGGFSLALPPSWKSYTKPIPSLEPGLKFAAWGITYEGHGHPWLYVLKWPADFWQEEKNYFEQRRHELGPGTLRVSEVSEIQFLDGVGYTFTSVHKDKAWGRRSETVYGILHDGYEYRLVFIVPLQYKDDHDWLFDDIVKAFDIIDILA